LLASNGSVILIYNNLLLTARYKYVCYAVPSSSHCGTSTQFYAPTVLNPSAAGNTFTEEKVGIVCLSVPKQHTHSSVIQKSLVLTSVGFRHVTELLMKTPVCKLEPDFVAVSSLFGELYMMSAILFNQCPIYRIHIRYVAFMCDISQNSKM
jgi:hypothetical protein